MSLPRYPKYKESGVGWLGKVPAHWDVVPVKRQIARVESGTSVNASDEQAFGDRVGVLKTSCVYAGFFDPSENKSVTDEDLDRVSCPIRPGTLIVSRMNTPELVGAAGVVRDAPANIYLPDRLWQIFFRGADASYMHYWTLTSAYRALVEASCTGTSSSMKNLGQEQFGRFPIALPPEIEQTAIAAFLDYETIKIDALVAEQERLIELLKEKRQSVISHAVTKGLNPDVSMKHSGLEWVGEIPAHWELSPLKYSITRIEQGWSPQCESYPAQDGEWRVLKVGCGNDDRFDPSEQKALPSDVVPEVKYEIRAGDILMSRGNTPELVGATTIVEQEHPRLLLCDLLYRFRSKPDRAVAAYLVLSLRSRHGRFQIERVATGTSSSMKKISQGDIRDFVLPLPPVPEQTAIVEFLRAQTSRFDDLTAEAQRAIELLHERRTALISAAVTGQIDVREAAGRAA